MNDTVYKRIDRRGWIVVPESTLALALLSGDYWDGIPHSVDHPSNRPDGRLMRWPYFDDMGRATGRYTWYMWHHNDWYRVCTAEDKERNDNAT